MTTTPAKQKYCFNPEEIDLLSSLIGEEFEGYYSDSLLNSAEFTYLYFCVGGKRLELENALKPIQYLDDFHDYAVLSVNVAEDKYFEKNTNNSRAKFCAVNKRIRSFDLVTDTLSVTKSSILEYQTVLTRGVIFHFEDGTEIAFDKYDNEEFIYIHEGVNTYEQFYKTDIEYDSPYVFNCNRTVESFSMFKESDVVKRNFQSTD